MKKFQFSLQTVLVYKQQVLDALQGEHAAVLAELHEQERVLEAVWARYRACNEEYRERQMEGLLVTEALVYQNGLRMLEKEIAQETAFLEKCQKREAQKRGEVVEAKKETSSIEKLKEKKLGQYQKAMQKSEEAFIDEFVSAARVTKGTED